MRVLILGGGGMLGHKVFQVLGEELETYATFHSKNGAWQTYPVYEDIYQEYLHGGVDVRNFRDVIRVFKRTQPDVAVNCVGIIKQVEEAQDPIISLQVNALFPHLLAEFCQAVGTRLIHISTDCVFSGRQGNYREEDYPDAEDLYGRTKLLGEVVGEGCLTIRTSIIGRDFRRNTGLLEWFMSSEGSIIQGYSRAVFSGLTTQSLAAIIKKVIIGFPELSGLYHVSSEPIDKYTLLKEIRETLDLQIRIEKDGLVEIDRSLDSGKFREETGIRIPDWEDMITELAQDDTPYDQWRKEHHETTG